MANSIARSACVENAFACDYHSKCIFYHFILTKNKKTRGRYFENYFFQYKITINHRRFVDHWSATSFLFWNEILLGRIPGFRCANAMFDFLLQAGCVSESLLFDRVW